MQSRHPTNCIFSLAWHKFVFGLSHSISCVFNIIQAPFLSSLFECPAGVPHIQEHNRNSYSSSKGQNFIFLRQNQYSMCMALILSPLFSFFPFSTIHVFLLFVFLQCRGVGFRYWKSNSRFTLCRAFLHFCAYAFALSLNWRCWDISDHSACPQHLLIERDWDNHFHKWLWQKQ